VAWAAFQAAVDGFARAGLRWYRARTLREWGEAHLARGEPADRERARELLHEAVTEFEAMGIPYYAEQARGALAKNPGF